MNKHIVKTGLMHKHIVKLLVTHIVKHIVIFSQRGVPVEMNMFY
jgi:hypothetical protein